MLGSRAQTAEGSQAWEQGHFGEESSKLIRCQPLSALAEQNSAARKKGVQILVPLLSRDSEQYHCSCL